MVKTLAQNTVPGRHSAKVCFKGGRKDALESESSLKYQEVWQLEDASHSLWVSEARTE